MVKKATDEVVTLHGVLLSLTTLQRTWYTIEAVSKKATFCNFSNLASDSPELQPYHITPYGTDTVLRKTHLVFTDKGYIRQSAGTTLLLALLDDYPYSHAKSNFRQFDSRIEFLGLTRHVVEENCNEVAARYLKGLEAVVRRAAGQS